jgi:hypothetical protein
LATLKDSFVKALLEEKPTITPDEIEAEWKQFQQEYNDWSTQLAKDYATGESA